MMKKFIRLFLLLSACLLSTHAFAVRATQEMLTKTQSDGSALNFFLRGDENFHFQETTDGFKLIENENGDLVYAYVSTAGTLSASDRIAHNPDSRTAEEIVFLGTVNQTEVRQIQRQQHATQPRRTIQRAATDLAGTIRIPVLLIQYADVKFTVANAQTAFTNQLNQAGYSAEGHSGSMRDYFLDNSFKKFSPYFDVTAPVTLSQNRAYYGENNANGDDKRPGEMIAEALQLANASFDFSKYDVAGSNGRPDGYIDFLMVIFAGHNEAENGGSNTIWPHSWSLYDASRAEGFTNPVVDGVRGGLYYCSSELMGSSGSKRAGIGTMCHEFAHVLGLNDMYDVDYELNGMTPGFGFWSLMDSGNMLNDGRTPPYLTAFEREQLGWGTVNELKTAGTYSLSHINTREIYRINTPKDYEYFLLENRQLSGWDKYLPGSGMLITRVYRDREYYFENNEINNVKGEERVNLLEANGAYYYGGYRSMPSDAFPGTANITQFDDEGRTPVEFSNLPGRFEMPANSLLWNGETLNKPILNIREKDNKIYFDFLKEQECIIPIINSYVPEDRKYTQIINSGNVTLSVSGSSIGSYAWYKSTDLKTVLGTSSTFSFNATSADQSGEYYCVVSNICGDEIISDVVTVRVREPFILWSAGNTLTIDAGIDLKQISVYNPLGQLVKQIPGQLGENTLQLAPQNVYIIKLDKKAVKIVM